MPKPKVTFIKLYPGTHEVLLDDELIAELHGPSGRDRRGWTCIADTRNITFEAEKALNDCWGMTIGVAKKDVLKTLKRLDYDIFVDYEEDNPYFKIKRKRK